MEEMKINVRIHNSHPEERVKMEIALFYVAVESSPFIGAHLEIYPYVP